jgi:hypothetical protein
MMKAVLFGKRRLDAVAATIPAKDRSDIEAVLPVVDGPAEVAKLERAREMKAVIAPAVEAEALG